MIQIINAGHAQNRTEVGYIAHFYQGLIVKGSTQTERAWCSANPQYGLRIAKIPV